MNIDTAGPDFIAWDDIHGIDEVKKEIEEIIDYLKNPALLRLRGVARIGGVLLAGSPGKAERSGFFAKGAVAAFVYLVMLLVSAPDSSSHSLAALPRALCIVICLV